MLIFLDDYVAVIKQKLSVSLNLIKNIQHIKHKKNGVLCVFVFWAGINLFNIRHMKLQKLGFIHLTLWVIKWKSRNDER